MSALGLIAKVIPAEGAIKLAIAGGALLLAFAGGFYQGAARVEQRLQKAQLETTATVLQTERQYRERENAIVKEYLDRIEVLYSFLDLFCCTDEVYSCSAAGRT